MSEVGKKLREIYEAMLRAYREEPNKEEGARKALDVYNVHIQEIEEIRRILIEIQDLHDGLLEGLKVLTEERSKAERRSRTVRTGGCTIIKFVPCGKNCKGCPHGPYVYRVYKEAGKQFWKYLGRA